MDLALCAARRYPVHQLVMPKGETHEAGTGLYVVEEVC